MLLFWKKSKKHYLNKVFHYMKSMSGQSKIMSEKMCMGAFAKKLCGGHLEIFPFHCLRITNAIALSVPHILSRRSKFPFQLNDFSRAKGVIYTGTITYLLYIQKTTDVEAKILRMFLFVNYRPTH